MPRCNICHKKGSITFPCKYCNCQFCSTHLYVDSHTCCEKNRAVESWKYEVRENIMTNGVKHEKMTTI